MTDANAIHRASTAKSELRETQAAFEAVRRRMVDQLLATDRTQVLEREKLYAGVRALDEVRAALLEVVAGGDVEQHAAAIKDAFRVV